jgi:2-phospho-L-lactate guanylyltransferase
MVAAAVPVKELAAAKERLSGFLSPPERRRLCVAMLLDVLDALRATPEVSKVWVVTSDRELQAILSPIYDDVQIVGEPAPSDLNRALRQASLELVHRGDSRMLVVPADLPLITPGMLSDFIHASEDASVAIVPDRSHRGTSLLLVRPPTAISPRFGADSFAGHLEEARRRSLRCSVFPGGRGTWDVDSPADLAVVTRHGHGTRTRAWLCEAGIDRRIGNAAVHGDSRRRAEDAAADAASHGAGDRSPGCPPRDASR